MARLDRRSFLRAAGLGALGVAAGCTSAEPGAAPTTLAPTSPSASPTRSARAERLRWERVDAGRGPGARRDYSLTAGAGALYVLGGRDDTGTLGDFWRFDVARGSWERLDDGPPRRLGHNAAFIDGRLLVFGGQDGATFYNDLWAFEPGRARWAELDVGGARPGPRYGGGGDAVGDALVITHGFENAGRYDDTWRFGSPRWREVSPGSNRPIKRCLIRTPYLPAADALVLFGGQTDGDPFLGDTWLYDVRAGRWREIAGRAPAARNVYAAAATTDRVYLFGGETANGPVNELWSFDGDRWTERDARDAPRARSGIEAAIADGAMFVFGGRAGTELFDDLWVLHGVE